MMMMTELTVRTLRMLDASRGQKLANLTSKTNISNLDTEITILSIICWILNLIHWTIHSIVCTLDYCNIKIDPMGQLFEEKWKDLTNVTVIRFRNFRQINFNLLFYTPFILHFCNSTKIAYKNSRTVRIAYLYL